MITIQLFLSIKPCRYSISVSEIMSNTDAVYGTSAHLSYTAEICHQLQLKLRLPRNRGNVSYMKNDI